MSAGTILAEARPDTADLKVRTTPDDDANRVGRSADLQVRRLLPPLLFQFQDDVGRQPLGFEALHHRRGFRIVRILGLEFHLDVARKR